MREIVPTLDDMTAALANFSLYVAVAGSVRLHFPASAQNIPLNELTITDVAIYVRDSFDFEEDQPLGCWDDQRNAVALEWSTAKTIHTGRELTCVDNKTFRDWRRQYNRGGDFLVFSDVKQVHLATRYP